MNTPNPYDPDKARAAAARRKTKTTQKPVGLLIAAALEAWTAIYTAITAPGTLEDFRKMFAGFGTEMSAATKSVLAVPYMWWFFAVLAIAQFIWMITRAAPSEHEKRQMKISIWVVGALFGAAVGWAAYGLYSEIFKVGGVV